MRGTPTPYFKALNRNFHVLGVDRQLFYLFIGLCLPIAVSAHLSWMMDGITLLLFMMLYMAGVFITRIDTQMLTIYRRHIHYQRYYPAHPSPRAHNVLIKASVPFYQGKRGFSFHV
jgi:type IV secretory pathway TrbD component